MKIFLATMLAMLSINSAYAGGHGYQGRHVRQEWRHERSDPGRWIVPALIGGVIGYELARPRVAYAPPAYPPVYQPAVVVRQEVYSVPAPQPVYREIIEYDPACGCYMHIQRQIGWR